MILATLEEHLSQAGKLVAVAVVAGISEADSDIRDLLHAPSGSAVAPKDRMVSSSDEDTSDEAFAGRHAALEAEEQQRFNTLAGENQISSSCDCCCSMCSA